MGLNWQVTNETLGSDHLIIKISATYNDHVHFTEKRNFKRADWLGYRNDLDDSLRNFNDSVNIQDRYDYLIDAINSACDRNIPKHRTCQDPMGTFRPKEYWAPSLSEAVAERRLALSTFRKNPTPENFNKLEEKIEKAKLLLQKAKSENFRKFCNGINETTSVSNMWQKMRWYKGYKKTKFYVPDEKLNEMHCSLAPSFVLNSPPLLQSRNELLDSPFIMQELEHSCKKKDTAPGSDGVTYSMVWNLPFVGKQYLLDLYNDIYLSGVVPSQWRNILIIPIPKLASNSSGETKVRPISLISCLCKLLHGMLTRRLEWFVEKYKILSPYTSGFRRAQSCLDNLVRLITYIQLGFINKCPTVACFIDIENAYNNILVDRLVITLDELEVGNNICKYLWSFLSARCLLIKNNNNTENMNARWTSIGLAQGDPLSPLLFNIATYKICDAVKNVFVSQYADDYVIYLSHKDITFCQRNLQGALNAIVILLDELGLKISETKSNVCVFSRGRKRHHISLETNNKPISSVECVKYLGLWIDRSLLWSKHINETIEKTSRFLNLLKVLAGPGWGIHPKHLRTLFVSLIRSRIDFGSFLYDSSAKVHLSKLDKLQNRALRIIGGFIKSSPIYVMESELCIVPLNLRRLYLAYKYCIKAISWTDNITVELLDNLSAPNHISYWRTKNKSSLFLVYSECKSYAIHSSNPLEMFKLNTWVTFIQMDKVIVDNLDCIKGPKKKEDLASLKYHVIEELHQKYVNWRRIYTDGSKSKNGRGAALFDPVAQSSFCFKINSYVSIMTLELIAISEALKLCVNTEQDIVIISDSKSALQHLARCASGYRGTSIAYKILKFIYELNLRQVNVKLQWVPSHIGLGGNEEADRLARLAITEGTEITIKPNYTEILPKFKSICFEKWDQYFQSVSKVKGIWYRVIQSQPPRFPWFIDCKMSRKYIVAAFRLRSGHYPTKRFGHLMKKIDSPNCEVCGVIDDVQHLLVECVKNQALRKSLTELRKINKYDMGTFFEILTSPESDAAKMVYDMALCR